MNTAPARYRLTPLGQRIAAENVGLVYYLHRRFPPSRPIQTSERISVGMEALIHAVALYDDSRGTAFSTYATKTIRTWWLRAEEAETLIWVPYYLWLREERERAARTDDDRIRRRLDAADRARGAIVSLSAVRGKRGRPVGWDVPDHRESDVEVAEEAECRDRERERLRAALDRLPERDRRVLLGRAAGETLKEIGRTIGVTRERVRQIEEQARAALRYEVRRESLIR